MAILVGSGKRLTTDDGIPYMWQSGDVTTTPNEVGIITASDGAANDHFGRSVAVGSGRIVVGAYRNDIGSNSDQGSAYIFDLNSNQLGIITASDGATNDEFGNSVAVGSRRIVVGASYAENSNGESVGAAYIYDLDGTNEIKITASDAAALDNFGDSVSVGCGKIVVGATFDGGGSSGSGSAYIYNLDGSGEVKITASDGAAGDRFGMSVAVGSGRIVVGAYLKNIGSNANQGAAYIFDLNGNQLGIITASDGAADDNFGYRVAVGSGRIVVGAYRNDIESNTDQGSAYVYDLDGNEVGIITASDGAADDQFGWSVAAGSGRIVVGSYDDDVNSNTDQGSAYVYNTPHVYNLYDAIDLNYG